MPGFFVSVLFILGLFSVMNAQTSNVIVHEIKTSALQYQAGEEVSGQFKLTNLLADPQQDLYYVLRTGFETDGSFVTLSETERQGPIVLEAQESKIINYVLETSSQAIVPEEIQILLLRRNGKVIGRSEIPVNVFGGTQEEFTELRLFNANQSISPGEVLDLGLLNDDQEEVLRFTLETEQGTLIEYKNGVSNDVVRIGELEVNEEQEFEVPFTSESGKYLLRIFTADQESFYDISYVTPGESASISLIQTNTITQDEGDFLEVEIFFSGGDYTQSDYEISPSFGEMEDSIREIGEGGDVAVLAVTDSQEQFSGDEETDFQLQEQSIPMSGVLVARLFDTDGIKLEEVRKQIIVGQDIDTTTVQFDRSSLPDEVQLKIEILNNQDVLLTKTEEGIAFPETSRGIRYLEVAFGLLTILVVLGGLFIKRKKPLDVVGVLILGGFLLNQQDVHAQATLMTDNQCTVEEAALPGCQEVYTLQGSEIPDQEDGITYARMKEIANEACVEVGYRNAIRSNPTVWYGNNLWRGPVGITCVKPANCGVNLCQYEASADASDTLEITSTKTLLTSVNSDLQSREGMCTQGRTCSYGDYTSDQILNTHVNRQNLCYLAGYRDYESYTDKRQTSKNTQSVLIEGWLWKRESDLTRHPLIFERFENVTPGGRYRCNDEHLPSSCTALNIGSECYSYNTTTAPIEALPFCSFSQNSYNDGDEVTLTCAGLPEGTVVGMSGSTCETEDNGDVVCTGIAGSGADRTDEAERNRISVDYPSNLAAIYSCGIEESPVRVIDTLTCKTPIKDMCSNIDGYQPVPPDGYVQESDGTCRLEDICPNTVAIETEIPEGFFLDDAGNCVLDTESLDVCPNIDGSQTSVPDGFIIDPAGDCVETDPGDGSGDVCLNIPGRQSSIPDGYAAQLGQLCDYCSAGDREVSGIQHYQEVGTNTPIFIGVGLHTYDVTNGTWTPRTDLDPATCQPRICTNNTSGDTFTFEDGVVYRNGNATSATYDSSTGLCGCGVVPTEYPSSCYTCDFSTFTYDTLDTPQCSGTVATRACNLADGSTIEITEDQHANLPSGSELISGTSRYTIGAQRGGAPRDCTLVANDAGLTLQTTPGFIDPGGFCEIDVVAGGVNLCEITLVEGIINDASICELGNGSESNPCVISADAELSITAELTHLMHQSAGSVIVSAECGLDADSDGVIDPSSFIEEDTCNLTPNIGEF